MFIKGKLNFDNPKVKDYLDSEVSYLNFHMKDTTKVQNEIYEEILSRINENEETYPEKYKDYYYYKKEIKDKNYPYYCRKKGSVNAKEEIYFDVNKEAEGKKLYQLKNKKVSHDNKYLAYAYNLTGSMEGTIRVRNLETGKDFHWEITDSTSSLQWDIDGKHLFYVKRGDNSRGKYLYRINIFKGPSSKKLVFDKPADRDNMFMWVGLSESERFLSVSMSEQGSNEIYLQI